MLTLTRICLLANSTSERKRLMYSTFVGISTLRERSMRLTAEITAPNPAMAAIRFANFSSGPTVTPSASKPTIASTDPAHAPPPPEVAVRVRVELRAATLDIWGTVAPIRLAT